MSIPVITTPTHLTDIDESSKRPLTDVDPKLAALRAVEDLCADLGRHPDGWTSTTFAAAVWAEIATALHATPPEHI